MMDRKTLLKRIHKAFGGVPTLQGDALCGFENYDTEDIVRDFAGKHWSELGEAAIRHNRQALPLLSPRGFQAYLPAFLAGCLSSSDESWRRELVTFTLMGLAPVPRVSGSAKRFAERVAALSDDQRDVVAAFLELMRVEGWAERSFPALAPGGLWTAEKK